MPYISYVEVSPAYGRDYRNAPAAKADWSRGKDFIDCTSGRYCSKRDFADDPNVRVIIRYDGQRKVTGAPR